MSRIPRSFIDELITRANIVEIIGARIALKKAGREYKACCPFHSEKTPSFWVSPEKQFYHCFGCGAHGTVLGFLMEHDRLPFPEAVEELAALLGLEVPREAGASAPRRESASLYDLMQQVARFYAECLARNERALQYLTRRGLDREIIERFGIGYAPNAWNEVLRRFGAAEEARRQLAEVGLIIARDNTQAREGERQSERYYDRFRDRVMFPIRDARGRVIAFGGRVIDQGEPKYLNSPETALFHKGRELYGLNEVRGSRASLTRLLVVEGYMDVVRLHQFGVSYAVATLGTATTPEHLKRIFQLVPEVTFAFDGDRAGRAAAWRALQNALPEATEGREIRFLFLPDGEDPDTLVAREGGAAFEARLAAALPLSEYLVREIGERVRTPGADGRARAAQLVRPLLQLIPPGIYRRLLIERLAQAFGFQRTPEELAQLLDVQIASPVATAAVRGASAGRGSLVRQAVRLLTHFPRLAQEIAPELTMRLSGLEEPGVPLLTSLLSELHATPAESTAQLLERWRERPESAHLARLAAAPELVPGPAAAQNELQQALQRLLQEGERQQLDRLLEKDRAGGLTAEEKLELQRLTVSLAREPQRVRAAL